VYVHPFAEEMNKSRRMAALSARSLSAAGFPVLMIDLYGCGDSGGDLADATWRAWVDDVIAAAQWLRERTGFDPTLWGLRAGCLLAREAAQNLEYAPNLIFWQPVVSGAQHLQQFLRLRVAQHVAGGEGEARIGTKELRAELESGATLEIAGYTLAPELALGLDAAELAPPRRASRVAWLEVSSSDPPELSPAGRLRMQAWQAAGQDVAEYAVAGLPFWQTQEIAECAALVEATRAAVLDWYR
jgi:exosortase A-associated hydrolase 2